MLTRLSDCGLRRGARRDLTIQRPCPASARLGGVMLLKEDDSKVWTAVSDWGGRRWKWKKKKRLGGVKSTRCYAKNFKRRNMRVARRIFPHRGMQCAVSC